MSELVISLLGKFSVSRFGATVIDDSWPRKKPAALLKLLALHPRRRLSRERAIDLLWPQADEQSGANNLYKALYYIRSELGDCAAAVRSEHGAVALDASAVTDVQRFDQLAAEAKRLPDDISAHQAAVEAYAGHLLPDDAYEWLEPDRARLRDTWRGLRLRLCRLLAAEGRLLDAISAIEPAVASDLADEQAQAAYMRVLALSGERNAALRQYDILRDALYDELAVTPSPETVALREEIAANRVGCLAPPRAAARELAIHHVTARDGVRIAYATYGVKTGIPLVMMPLLPWSDLLAEWEFDEARQFVEALASRRPVVRYDCRSLGQSQREVRDLSIESQVDDLEAVVDALRLETFDVFVGANTGPQALTYASRHPDRLRRLVCFQTWYSGPSFMAVSESVGYWNMARADWYQFCASAAPTAVGRGASEAFVKRHLAWLLTTPRDTFQRLLAVAATSDATDLLPSIRQPVLAVLSANALPNIESDQVRALARNLKRGMFRQLDVGYAPWASGYEELVAAVHSFLDASDPVQIGAAAPTS